MWVIIVLELHVIPHVPMGFTHSPALCPVWPATLLVQFAPVELHRSALLAIAHTSTQVLQQLLVFRHAQTALGVMGPHTHVKHVIHIAKLASAQQPTIAPSVSPLEVFNLIVYQLRVI